MVLDAEYEKKVGFFSKKITKMAKMWLKKEKNLKKNSLNGRKKSPKTARIRSLLDFKSVQKDADMILDAEYEKKMGFFHQKILENG